MVGGPSVVVVVPVAGGGGWTGGGGGLDAGSSSLPQAVTASESRASGMSTTARRIASSVLGAYAVVHARAPAARGLYLAGHDHHYERFRPIGGVRQILVGTGGRSLYPVLRRLPASEARSWRTYGVLSLRLRPASYAWRFVPVPGSRFRDAGSSRCR